MWYFAWILGLLLACACGVLAAIWYEYHFEDEAPGRQHGST
ncbi:MAG: cytochrome bd-I oxidase subunit CydX [Zetaproteobacteria bacterium]|nr:MAG: cytochrome bd-I oxidase subunit CydX [Zetaproteobacteria bacterium]